jgi:threonine/homoserine/homoserine lactone efflux protein
MELSALAVFAGTLIVAAGSPGPSIAALVARVLSHGARSVLPFLAAMWVGEAIWLSMAVFGLAYLAQLFQPLFAILKYLGVAYLLYLAYRMWTAPADVHDRQLPGARSSLRMFLAGMAITLGNPKIMVFYLALLPSILDLTQVSIAGWASLTLTMMLVLIAVDVAWVIFAAEARRFLKSSRAMRIANKAGASLMGGAAAAIATQ